MTTESPNMFQAVLTDAAAVRDEFIGPNYPYYKYIKDPASIGMSSRGTLAQMGKNIDGLVEYVNLLVAGKSKASATGQPLGNKFFLKTGGKCTSNTTGEEVDRYIYINNVPQGNIPLLSSGAGVNFTEFRGLIPGIISNLNAFNPMGMFQSFLAGSTPDCQEITMETIDIHNNRSTETHYMTFIDIQNTDPCSFMDKKNPITKTKCRETFVAQNTASIDTEVLTMTMTDVLFWMSLGTIGAYLIYRIMAKTKMAKR